MTRDEIIRMARDAGSIDSEDVIETVWAAFSAAEREAICPIVYGHCGSDNDAQRIVDAIRARGKK